LHFTSVAKASAFAFTIVTKNSSLAYTFFMQLATRRLLLAFSLLSRAAFLTISDGTTLLNTSPFNNSSDDYELDGGSGAGGGTILNQSDWTQSGSSIRYIYNSYTQGSFINEGTLNASHSGTAGTHLSAIFQNTATGTLNATSNYIYLQGGGTYVPAARSTPPAETST
jgi:hypothetical protein